MSPRWRKVLRDLWLYKTRTLLVVVSITVGSLALGIISGARMILARELTSSYLAVNPASASIGVSSLDEETMQAVRNMPGVKCAEGIRVIVTRVETGSGKSFPIWLYARPEYEDGCVNLVLSEDGAWPPSNRELLLERGSLAMMGVTLGDSVQIDVGSRNLQEMVVVGTVWDPIQFPSALAGRAYGYVTFDTLEWLGEPRTYNELDLVVDGDEFDKAVVQQITNRVRDRIEERGATVAYVWIPTPGKHPADEIVQPILIVLNVLGVVALLLGGLLVTNTISSLLVRHIRQIGVMKTVGARNLQIVAVYLFMATLYGLLALVFAVPLGRWGSRELSSFVASLLNVDIASFKVSAHIVLLQVVISLFVPFIAALPPVVSGVCITVREAIGSYGLAESQSGKGFFQWLIEKSGLVLPFDGFSRPLLLSLRNTFRRKMRLFFTLATLALGGGIFVGVLSVRDSATGTLMEMSGYWQHDVEVSFYFPYRAERIERQALSVPGVAGVESWGESGVWRLRADGSESDAMVMVALPAATDLFNPAVVEGRWLLPNDQNAIVVNTDVLRNESDIEVGKQVILKVQGRELPWRVVGVVKSQLSGPMVYVNHPYFTYVTRDVGLANSVRITTEQHDAAFQSQVAKRLEARFKQDGLQISVISTVFDLRSILQQQFDIVVVFLSIMSLVLAGVGGISLTGMMMLNVSERTREIGVMRAIGASSSALLQIVIVEGLCVGVSSWLLSSVLAWPLGKLLSDAVGWAFIRSPLTYVFSVSGVLVWLIVVIVLSTTACLLPARYALLLSVRETLTYE